MATTLVIGGGGREHAIAWALARSGGRVVVAPGNPGAAAIPGVSVAPYTSVADGVALARQLKPAVVIVGPEAPLAEGIADELAAAGIPCFGPTRAAARLESSKAFCKAFMERHAIPTAAYRAFTDFAAAEAYIRAAPHRVVIKASGLAAGKGVVVPSSVEEAVAAARSMLVERAFGEAGGEVVVEEFLQGAEASVLAFSDGKTVVPLPAAQDHKRVYEFDAGPNTGGMGAYAPAPLVDAALMAEVVARVLQPAVIGMAAEGTPFVGVLFAGLMVTPARELKVLEFNVRLGDPETEVLLPLLDTPLLDIVTACVQGRLAEVPVRVQKGVVAATVVAVSGGYPGAFPKGLPIAVGPRAAAACRLAPGDKSGSYIFHAGTATREADGALVTAGGRVLTVTSLAPSLKAALAGSYSVLEDVSVQGGYYRRDIGGGYVRPKAATEPLRVGVLGSTRGSSLAPILAAVADGSLGGVAVSVVVANKPDAGILDKARAAGVPAVCIESKGRERAEFEAEVIRALDAHAVDVVLLVGFMRVLTPAFIDRYAHRILNVHPSLLPEFAGGMDLEVHAAVLAAKKARTGCTVHLVDAKVDAGFVLVQKACDVAPEDTAESLKAKVQALEGPALIEALRMYADDAPLDLLATLRRHGGSWGAIAPLLPATRLPAPATHTGRLTYAAAGVDIDAGDALVENIKPLAKATARAGGDADLGGFGGLFDLKAAGYEDPLLVSGTDGVGTKLRVAQIADVHSTVGIDLVAMSVNDLVVQGAEPLLFLDYFATGALDVKQATDVVAGIAEGCKQAGCALIGGETAEMPSMYAPGDYDLAGFSVGAVERSRVLPAWDKLQAGDVLLGIASSGVHSNGFSLVRRIVAQYNVDWQAPPPFASPARRLCDAVLTPTKIYIKCLLPSIKEAGRCRIKAMAHITGGGLPDNLPRVLKDGLQARIDATSWPILPVFRWMQSVGTGVEPAEMARTFNLGIGMVVVVGAEDAAHVKAAIEREGEAVYTIGCLAQHTDASQPVVLLEKLAEAFAAPL